MRSSFSSTAYTNRLVSSIRHDQKPEIFTAREPQATTTDPPGTFQSQCDGAQIDYQHKRNLKREVVARFAQSDWIDRKQNLLTPVPAAAAKPTLPVRLDTPPACANIVFVTIGFHGCCRSSHRPKLTVVIPNYSDSSVALQY